MFIKKIALALAFSLLLGIPAYAIQAPAVPGTQIAFAKGSSTPENHAETTGTIQSVQKDQITIYLTDGKSKNDFLVLNLTKDTLFHKCKLSTLTPGQRVYAIHSMTRTKTVPKQTTTYEITLVNDPAPTFYYNNSWNNGNSCMPNEEELHGKITQVIEMNDFLLLKVTGKVDEDAEKTFLLIVTKETELKTGHLKIGRAHV